MLTEKLSTSDSDFEPLIVNPLNKDLQKLKYVCKFADCSKRFKRQTHLDRHKYHHDGIKTHVCTYENCDKSYIISTHLKRHIQTYHEKLRKSKNFKCTVPNCKKSFDSLYNVERHITNTHNNSKTYVCKVCNKDFPRKLVLRRHEVAQHKTEYPYKCDTCNKGYIQEIHFKNHKCLQNKSLYKCERCNEQFSKWSLLIEHSKTKHDNAFTCSCCNREFHRKIDLQNHENSVKRKQENQNSKVECPYEGCGRVYNYQKNLTHHINVSHLCKRYKCPFAECTKELASKQKVNQHIKKIHESLDKASKKGESVKKPRKPRKDLGKSKRSYATILSNIVAHTSIEKKILNRETDMLDIVLKDSDISHSETENDEKIVNTVVALELEKF